MDSLSTKTTQPRRVLFLSYNGLLEPLLYSQGIVYLKELTRQLPIEIVVVSFEKVRLFLSKEEKRKINLLQEELALERIQWYWLRYHKYPHVVSSIYDICAGVVVVTLIALRKRVSFIHARSYVPAAIAYFVKMVLRINYLFDMRGFMIDDYFASGSLSCKGVIGKFAKKFEKVLLKNSAYIVVLTEEARKALKTHFGLLEAVLVDTIPCCVEMSRFAVCQQKSEPLMKSLGLEGKFILLYVGSLGEVYQLDEMLDFFRYLLEYIPEAYFLLLTPDLAYFSGRAQAYSYKQVLTRTRCISLEPQQIAEYLQLGDAGVAFYQPSFSKKATCPTKIGEYLSCGIPFIINKGVGDTEGWTKQFGIGVIVQDLGEVSYRKAIEELLLLKRDTSLALRCRDTASELLSLPIAAGRYRKAYKFMFKELI